MSDSIIVCHAELNAIVNAYKSGENLDGSKIYVTFNPCNECAKLIVQSNIKKVYFKDSKDADEFKASKKMFDITGIQMQW